MNDLSGKTYLVTGASSGIGEALCKQLIAAGAEVLGVSRNPDSLSLDISPIEADLTDRDEIEAIFANLGKIDGLINSAGVAYSSPITEGDPYDWEEMWRTNVLALALCCQRSLKHFPKEGGRIVNVSSMSGHRVPPSGGFYAPTKFAVRGITDALRTELKSMNSAIQVSTVSPGFVDTPLLDRYFKGREQVLEATKESMRMLKPEDIATTIMTILTAPEHVEIGDISIRSTDQLA